MSVTVRVFDPPMCCASGICGTAVDPALVRFAADLQWLASQGIDVERHGLAFEPRAFVSNAVVNEALESRGEGILPLVLVGDQIASEGVYPSREALAAMAGLPVPADATEAVSANANSSAPIAPDAADSRRATRPVVRTIVAMAVAAGALGIPVLLKRMRPQTARPSAVALASVHGTCSESPRPRLVDLGTETCAPCRAMLHVMDELRRDYGSALDVQFVNVQEDESALGRYGVSVIPFQVFYSPDGRELYRHVGLMPVRDVVEQWRQLGYDLTTCGGSTARR